MQDNKLLEKLKKELVVKKVPLKEKIKVDEETYKALNFLAKQGLPIEAIIEEAITTWRKKGVVKIANEIEKSLDKVAANDGGNIKVNESEA